MAADGGRALAEGRAGQARGEVGLLGRVGGAIGFHQALHFARERADDDVAGALVGDLRRRGAQDQVGRDGRAAGRVGGGRRHVGDDLHVGAGGRRRGRELELAGGVGGGRRFARVLHAVAVRVDEDGRARVVAGGQRRVARRARLERRCGDLADVRGGRAVAVAAACGERAGQRDGRQDVRT